MIHRCPTSPTQPSGDPHTIAGCGSTNVAGPDDEGLFDCLDCGIWFDPMSETTTPDAASLVVALTDVATWLTELACDGPDLCVNAHLKTAHEARELAQDANPEEWADVAICLVGARSARAGILTPSPPQSRRNSTRTGSEAGSGNQTEPGST